MDLSVFEFRVYMNLLDGCCKMFDDSVDGYGWGEGCGMIVFKWLLDV